MEKSDFIELHLYSRDEEMVLVNKANISYISVDSRGTAIYFNSNKGDNIYVIPVKEDYETVKKLLTE